MLTFLYQLSPYLLILALIAVEISCFALTSREFFFFLFKKIQVYLLRNQGLIIVPIPNHLKGAILGGGLVENSKITVTASIPMVAEPESFFLTTKEANATAGTIYYVDKVNPTTIELSTEPDSRKK